MSVQHDNRTISPCQQPAAVALSIAAAAFALLAVTIAGCASRTHLSKNFGVANRTFFGQQARAASNGPAQGLDSEEAAAIHQHYRETLSTRGAPPRSDSVLILQGDRGAASKRP